MPVVRRVGRWFAVGAVAACLLAGLPGTAHAATAIRILTLGNSITAPCGNTPPGGYCGPLDAMLSAAGVAHVFVNEAVSGTDCGYTSTNIRTFLTRDLPNPSPNDIVLLDCGTNNVPGPKGSSSANALGTQWRTIVEAVHGYGVRLGVSFIGYSNPRNASTFGASLPALEANANDEIFRNLQLYPRTWFAGLADFQQLPGDLDYLDSGGIHPNALGATRMAAIWYRSLRSTTGWPDTVPQPCGMWGYRPGGTPPSFTACTAGDRR
jgi:lysophospholipase L1-like esterase